MTDISYPHLYYEQGLEEIHQMMKKTHRQRDEIDYNKGFHEVLIPRAEKKYLDYIQSCDLDVSLKQPHLSIIKYLLEDTFKIINLPLFESGNELQNAISQNYYTLSISKSSWRFL